MNLFKTIKHHLLTLQIKLSFQSDVFHTQTLLVDDNGLGEYQED